MKDSETDFRPHTTKFFQYLRRINNMKTLQDYIDKLNALNFKDMYNGDFHGRRRTTSWRQFLLLLTRCVS